MSHAQYIENLKWRRSRLVEALKNIESGQGPLLDHGQGDNRQEIRDTIAVYDPKISKLANSEDY